MNSVICRIDHSKHKQIMVRILHDIYQNKVLKTKLVFKWWTALYLFYNLDRFSTDLDFDLMDWIDEEEVLKNIKKISQKYWDIKECIIKRHTIFVLLSYWTLDHNIKIEVNRRGITWDFEPKNLIWINVLLLKLPDLCANKLIVLTNRNKIANRDFYDIDFIFKNNFEINQNIILQRTWLNLKQYFEFCAQFIDNLPAKYNALDWLWIVLDPKQKAYVKNKMLPFLKQEFLLRSL